MAKIYKNEMFFFRNITQKIRQYFQRKLYNYLQIDQNISAQILRKTQIWGNPEKLHIDSTAKMTNTIFNTSSGIISVGANSFAGHGVMIITGSHNIEMLSKDRQIQTMNECDIIIGVGVWLGSGAIILGPCRIGDHSVIAAGAVVSPRTEIAPFTVYGGVPARYLKTIHQSIPE